MDIKSLQSIFDPIYHTQGKRKTFVAVREKMNVIDCEVRLRRIRETVPGSQVISWEPEFPHVQHRIGEEQNIH